MVFSLRYHSAYADSQRDLWETLTALFVLQVVGLSCFIPCLIGLEPFDKLFPDLSDARQLCNQEARPCPLTHVVQMLPKLLLPIPSDNTSEM
jgi:hypothetical protein